MGTLLEIDRSAVGVVQLVCVVARSVAWVSIAAAYILNALAPIPPADSAQVLAWVKAHASSLAADSPRIAEWLTANAGKTASDAMTALLSADGVAAMTPAIRNWTLFSHSTRTGRFSFNAAFFIGAALMLLTFAIQHRGILGTASVQKYIGLMVILPMLIVGVVPILTGQINWSQLLAARSARPRPMPRSPDVEHRRLDPRARRHVHRRMVDLRL